MWEYRDEIIRESHRFRDLGRYADALALFEQVEAEHQSLDLDLEISKLLLRMGRRDQACDRIASALEKYSSSEHDVLVLAYAKWLHSTNTLMQTARPSEPLKILVEVYNEFLSGSPVEDYTERMAGIPQVLMEYSYAALFDILGRLGYSVQELPKTSKQKIRELFLHCMARKWFETAELVAVTYSDYHSSNEDVYKSSLHEQLMLEPTVPNLIHAKSLIKYSQLLENDGKSDLAKETINKARAIYEEQQHAFGAQLIEMDQLQSPSPTLSALERIAKIQEIKNKLKTTGNWHDAAWASQYMYRITLGELSDSKLAENLYEESLKLPGFSQGSIRWIFWQFEVFRSLAIRGLHTGKSLASLKALHNSLVSSEAPRLKDETAMLLSEVYEYLDNKIEAAKWRSSVRDLSRVPFLLLPEPFIERIRTATSFPNLDEEMFRLDEILEQLVNQTSDDVPFHQRGLAVSRMCTIADEYLNQYQLLGIESTRHLTNHCFQHVEPVLSRIDVGERNSCIGQMLQTKARLLSSEATLGPSIQEELVALEKSVVVYEEALHHYQNTGLSLAAGFTSAKLASPCRRLWELTGKLPNSQWFRKTAKLLDHASVILKRHGIQDAYHKNARFLLDLWFENYKARLHRPPGIWESYLMWLKSWIGITVDSPLKKTKEYLEQLEQTIDRKRHDLSLLTTEEALGAKQKLRNHEDIKKLYGIAIPFYALQNDMDGVWWNIQKSKARSVSDLLGLGVVLPKDLATRIDRNDKAKTLLEREQQLLKTIENNSTDSQFLLQAKLDAHRDAMKQNNHLRELLELREGVPVTISRLRALSEVSEDKESKCRIFFADYVIAGGRISLFVVFPDSIRLYNLRSTEAQVNAWREKHLQVDNTLDHDDDEDNIAALQELTPLVEPLGQVSEEGNLIVLCASGALHAIPLHAALLEEGSRKSLIDRNPVVYCPSMTVFEQCVTRARAATPPDSCSGGGQALLAVYETPDKPGWEEQRAEAYETFAELAEEVDGARVFTGAEVTDERFRKECESAKIVHFLGHCNSGAEGVMQHLVLGARDRDATDQQPAGDNEIHVDARSVPTAPFTISDLFATSVRATHFNLIACGSASQIIGSGDEPWGIVTALLCAGATSVGGTMWPIQVGTGEMFMKWLYKEGIRSGGEGGILDLAVAHQKAVKKLKKHHNTREPYHWAAFVLHGAWFCRF